MALKGQSLSAGISQLRASTPAQQNGMHRHRASQPMAALPLQHMEATSQEQLADVHRLAQVALGDISEGLEAPVQLLYLVTLLGFLVVGAYLVVRQVNCFTRILPTSRHLTWNAVDILQT